ncbi:uncharacterized protein METZ01_LOCUS47927 [marine metagenome]|uniref:Uncharacterized protein n=1 Tax=marine metagenome TaxID=408172 RepID=A0A381S1P4_9ZZZZ
MESKERVLTLASAARRAGIDPEELRQLIDGGTLDVVETEGGKYFNRRKYSKRNIKDIQTIEATKPNIGSIIPDEIKGLLAQAANFIERQENELSIYREREEKHISLLKGAEKQISKALDQLSLLYENNINLNKENRKILKSLIKIQSDSQAK